MSLYYPKLNPFIMESCEGYAQPFNLSDRTAVQLVQDSTGTDVPELSLVSCEGDTVKAFAPRDVSTLAGFRFTTYDVDFRGLQEGLYRLRLFARGLREPLYSCPVCLKEQHEETVAIYATSVDNIQDVNFSVGVGFFLRVQGGFFLNAMNPKSDDTVYQDEDTDFVLLSSVPYETYRLNIGGSAGIPDSLQKVINRLFSLSKLTLDGVPYVRVEGAEWEAREEDEYSLRSWELEVAEPKANSSLSLAMAARWRNYRCQRQREPLSYRFAFRENGGTALSRAVSYLGESVSVDIVSIRADLFYPQLLASSNLTWARVVSLTHQPDSSSLRATVQVDANGGQLREGVILFKQDESEQTVTLTLRQGAGSYPLKLTVSDASNATISKLEATLDDHQVVSLDFSNQHEATLHLGIESKLTSLLLTTVAKDGMDVARISGSVMATPRGELQATFTDEEVPLSRRFTPTPPIGAGGSQKVNVRITPKLRGAYELSVRLEYVDIGMPYNNYVCGFTATLDKVLQSGHGHFALVELEYALYDRDLNIVGYGTSGGKGGFGSRTWTRFLILIPRHAVPKRVTKVGVDHDGSLATFTTHVLPSPVRVGQVYRVIVSPELDPQTGTLSFKLNRSFSRFSVGKNLHGGGRATYTHELSGDTVTEDFWLSNMVDRSNGQPTNTLVHRLSVREGYQLSVELFGLSYDTVTEVGNGITFPDELLGEGYYILLFVDDLVTL